MSTSPDWKDLPSNHSLARFAAELPGVLQDADYNEMYGVQLEVRGEGYGERAESSSYLDRD